MKIVLGYNKALSHVTALLNKFVVHELNDFNDPTQVRHIPWETRLNATLS
jgi:hypothetical protein